MTHVVEYEGTKAKFREPMGREAVEFVRAFRALPEAPQLGEGETPTPEQERQTEEFLYALSNLIHDWMPKLVVTPAKAKGNKGECWKLYKALGRSTGPLVQLFTELVGESMMIPPEKLEALPLS